MIDKKLVAQVEKLVAWKIDTMGNPTVEEVLTALKRKNFRLMDLPDGMGLGSDVLHSFRKRNTSFKRKLVQKAFARRAQTSLPTAPPTAISETLTSSVSSARPPKTEIQLSRGEVLAEIARKSPLELKEEEGEIFISLRCFEKLIGKRPDNLQRTLLERGFPVVSVSLPNERQQLRETPAIHIDYIFAVIGMSDLHGMNPGQRNQLFTLQRELPNWMKRFNGLAVSAPPALISPKPEPKLVTFVNTVTTKLVSVFSDGLTKLTVQFDKRFDRIERLLVPSVSDPSIAPNMPRYVRVDPPVTRVNGTSKVTTRPPFKDLNYVVTEINKKAIKGGRWNAKQIIARARFAGIYESPLWGSHMVGPEDAILLEGEPITWWFDVDAVELLKEKCTQEQKQSNGARV